MRISALILLVTMVQVSASTHAQTISLSKNNASLVDILLSIRKQTDFDFLYSKPQLLDAKKVSIHVSKASITEVLDKCFENQPFTYIISDKTVTVKRKAPTLLENIIRRFSAVSITGSVIDSLGNPLPGASVQIINQAISVRSNENGRFQIVAEQEQGVLLISYLGFKTQQIKFSKGNYGPFLVILKEDNSQLNEIEVVSTGYQHIPKERATGSFTLIDNTLLNRRVGANILDRLDGVTSGLIFNKALGSANNSAITIRGRSTIFANPNPLIILDNFPYDGDLNNINPNDIENISILKDAAAASIWGVKAGNGVIVITTKKGSRNLVPSFSLNSNVTIGAKPDQNYPYQMSSADYIDLEKYLYDKGYYAIALNNDYAAISPAVALMQNLSKNKITAGQYTDAIDLLKQQDVRKDLDRYIYRQTSNQQYNLNISGGSTYQKYFISGGYDKNLGSLRSDQYQRLSLNANHTLNLFKDKLELYTGITFSKSKISSNQNNYKPYTPYDQLADENGNALAVTDNSNQRLRAQYVDTAGKGKLLDWHYKPIDENVSNRINDQLSYRLLTGLTYTIIPGLKLQGNYQYERGQTENLNNANRNSFYTRDMINRFSSINSNTGLLSRVIPIGDILYRINSNFDSQYARTQLNYDANFHNKHAISAIAGFEIKDYHDELTNQRFYGYDSSIAANSNASINPLQLYKIYYDPFGSQRIPTAPAQNGNIDRYRSIYANAAYTYLSKYTLSASARKDETNIFGVNANQKGVPLWSAGIAWNLSSEDFYRFSSLPYLKLKATYGYNGNVDKTTSAYLTAIFAGTTFWNSNFSQVSNPPNPSLRWEKIRNMNVGFDFGTKNNRINGSVEFYSKTGTDLIGNSPIAPQSGVEFFRGNNADIQTRGTDISLNFNVLEGKKLNWNINTFYSYSHDRITDYKMNQGINGDIVNSNYSTPLVGYPYYSVFAFKTAGLDASGNPIGTLNGQNSTDYTAIYNSLNATELVYRGSGTPTSFGSIRNNLNWQNWALSINVVYKLGYYFRRTGVFSGSIYSYNQGDYDQRWQKAGDESLTRVPALVYPMNPYRDLVYQSSADLVEKGDQIRLQDIRLSYQLDKKRHLQLPFNNIQFYAYLNNLGILWRANDQGIDPDAGTQGFPASRSLAIGFSANF